VDLLERLQAALAGRYRIERELGRGGMATVYLAEDLKHGRRVALKVLRPEVSNALGADRFLREIGIAGRLQHPHILSLHDSGEAGGTLYYAMPLVEGESLRARLGREVQLDVAEAVGIASEVAEALAYAHGMGCCIAISSRRTSCSRQGTPWWRISALRGPWTRRDRTD
jgi:eukaryotic-like serine/threonine-protein kinase